MLVLEEFNDMWLVVVREDLRVVFDVVLCV